MIAKITWYWDNDNKIDKWKIRESGNSPMCVHMALSWGVESIVISWMSLSQVGGGGKILYVQINVLTDI